MSKIGRAARRELAQNRAWDRAYAAAAHREMTLADIEHEQRGRAIDAALERCRQSEERTRTWIDGRTA